MRKTYAQSDTSFVARNITLMKDRNPVFEKKDGLNLMFLATSSFEGPSSPLLWIICCTTGLLECLPRADNLIIFRARREPLSNDQGWRTLLRTAPVSGKNSPAMMITNDSKVY
jgi:hypothetical protein